MKKIVNHEKYGEFVYEESNFLGKVSLTLNGNELTKMDKKSFQLFVNDEPPKTVNVKGSLLMGATLEIENETVTVTEKPKWYEIVLALIPFLLVLVWGNSVSLCEIVPVVGGLIGGAISALLAFSCFVVMRNIRSVVLKILVAVIFTALSFLICWFIALLILGRI